MSRIVSLVLSFSFFPTENIGHFFMANLISGLWGSGSVCSGDHTFFFFPLDGLIGRTYHTVILRRVPFLSIKCSKQLFTTVNWIKGQWLGTFLCPQNFHEGSSIWENFCFLISKKMLNPSLIPSFSTSAFKQ